MQKKTTRRKKRKKPASILFIAGITVYLAILFVNQQVKTWDLQQKIDEVQAEIELEEVRQSQLQEKIHQLNSLDYVEKAAREELGLLKEGETPYMTISPTDIGRGSGITPLTLD